MRTALILLSIIFISTESQAASKKVGWRESFGGNSSILEFKQMAKDIADVLVQKKFKNNFGLEVNTLPRIIELSSVDCGTELFLDDQPKDAINFPNQSPQLIILDCDKWDTKLSYAQKMNLAIHEYLPLAGVDDSSYEHSTKIFNFYKKVFSNNGDINSMLLHSIRICNVEVFDQLVGLGANIFELDEYGSVKSLDVAINSLCDDIIEILADKGVDYNQTENTPSYIYLIERNFFLYDRREQNASLTTLKLLISKWPKIIDFEFTDTRYSSFSDLHYDCYKGSSVMHVLASKSRYERGFDHKYFNNLALLGFSLDKKNACGDTPKDLLERSSKKPVF